MAAQAPTDELSKLSGMWHNAALGRECHVRCVCIER